MTIAAHKSWQINNALNSDVDDENLMRFNFVEFSLNIERSIVELSYEENDEDVYPMTHQYLTCSWRQAAELANRKDVVNHSILIIIPRYGNWEREKCDKYAINDIDEIFRLENSENENDVAALSRLADQSEYFTHISPDAKKYTIKDCVYSSKES